MRNGVKVGRSVEMLLHSSVLKVLVDMVAAQMSFPGPLSLAITCVQSAVMRELVRITL